MERAAEDAKQRMSEAVGAQTAAEEIMSKAQAKKRCCIDLHATCCFWINPIV